MNEFELDNIVDYRNIKKLEWTYFSYFKIQKLAMMGNNTAAAIIVDIKDAYENAGLTEKQKLCIARCLIYQTSKTEMAAELGITHTGVTKHIKSGLRKIQKYLGN